MSTRTFTLDEFMAIARRVAEGRGIPVYLTDLEAALLDAPCSVAQRPVTIDDVEDLLAIGRRAERAAIRAALLAAKPEAKTCEDCGGRGLVPCGCFEGRNCRYAGLVNCDTCRPPPASPVASPPAWLPLGQHPGGCPNCDGHHG